MWDLNTRIHMLKRFNFFRLSTSLKDSSKLQLWSRLPSISKMMSTPTLMLTTTLLQNGLRYEFTQKNLFPHQINHDSISFSFKRSTYFTPEFLSSCMFTQRAKSFIKGQCCKCTSLVQSLFSFFFTFIINSLNTLEKN